MSSRSGLNGLGACGTQYASGYGRRGSGTGTSIRCILSARKYRRSEKEPYSKSDTGTRIRWKPDIEVFTEIDVPIEYFKDTLKRQAIVNPNRYLFFRNQTENGFEEERLVYEKGLKTTSGKSPGRRAHRSAGMERRAKGRIGGQA